MPLNSSETCFLLSLTPAFHARAAMKQQLPNKPEAEFLLQKAWDNPKRTFPKGTPGP